MALKEELESRVSEIFRSRWESRDGVVVPAPKDVGLGNDAVTLNVAILYADLRGSTDMVDNQPREFAAEVYKAYLHCAGRIIQANDGVITAYDGDRVMAVFLGDRRRTNAVTTALNINHAVQKIINPGIKTVYGEKYTVRQVVGVDASDVFVSRTGVWGNNDLVWVGPAANYAAKLTELGDDGHSTYITYRVFDHMGDHLKKYQGRAVWECRSWTAMSGLTIYRSSWTWPLRS